METFQKFRLTGKELARILIAHIESQDSKAAIDPRSLITIEVDDVTLGGNSVIDVIFDRPKVRHGR
jgi:hypothetical protein